MSTERNTSGRSLCYCSSFCPKQRPGTATLLAIYYRCPNNTGHAHGDIRGWHCHTAIRYWPRTRNWKTSTSSQLTPTLAGTVENQSKSNQVRTGYIYYTTRHLTASKSPQYSNNCQKRSKIPRTSPRRKTIVEDAHKSQKMPIGTYVQKHEVPNKRTFTAIPRQQTNRIQGNTATLMGIRDWATGMQQAIQHQDPPNIPVKNAQNDQQWPLVRLQPNLAQWLRNPVRNVSG
jgi:hypothetical protein